MIMQGLYSTKAFQLLYRSKRRLRISGCTPRIDLMLSVLRGNITHTKEITLFGNQPTIFIVWDIDRLSLPCSGRSRSVIRHTMLIS